MSAPRLVLEGVTKSFFGTRVLHEVSFEAQTGQVLGLVGENGSGKSTTMNILAGVLEKEGGRILLDGTDHSPKSRREADATGIAFIQQELSTFPNLTVAENLFLGRFPRAVLGLPLISRAKSRARARELLRRVDLAVAPDALVETLSSGERQLLEVARALGSDARVMIFDEPTTSLTPRESERLFEIIVGLRSQGVAVIYISHALEDVLRLSDRVVVMRDGRVTLQVENAQLSAHDLIMAMVGRSIEALFPERPAPTMDRQPLLEVREVTEPDVVEDISFQVQRGEIIGLAGLMGAGRSELARILFGLESHRGGTQLFNGNALPSQDLAARIQAGMAFLTEDRRHEGLMMDASVEENIALAALPRFASGAAQSIARDRLSREIAKRAQSLNLKSAALRSTPVRALSGGNQQKVVLGRWLLAKPSLFILDEPTRGVDIGAKEEIYRLLAQCAEEGMGILVISSEIEELMGLCDRILVMHRGRLQARFQREQFDRERILKAAFGHEDVA